MIEILLGLLFTILPLLFGVYVYYIDGTIMINDEMIVLDNLSDIMRVSSLLGVFVLVGAIFLIVGIRKTLRNHKTKMYGIDTFGIIMQSYPSCVYVNNKPLTQLEIAVVVDYHVQIFKESVGINDTKWRPGDCVAIQYYEGDINIEADISFAAIPECEKELLKSYYDQALYNLNHQGDEPI